MAIGILGCGIYLPRYRLVLEDLAKVWGGRGRGERAVAGPDEDAITMGVEAAAGALAEADPRGIDYLVFCSTSAPYAEHSSAGIVADVLGLETTAEAVDLSASPRGALAALRLAEERARGGARGETLVVAADCRQPARGSDLENSMGAGGVALRLGPGGRIAELEALSTIRGDFLDRWRGAEQATVQQYEPRFAAEYGYLRQSVAAGRELLARLGRSAADYAAVAVAEPDGRSARRLLAQLGFGETRTFIPLMGQVGDTGTAGALLSLAAALERSAPGDRILLLGYGSGTADAASFQVCTGLEEWRESVAQVSTWLERKTPLDYIAYARMSGILAPEGEPIEMAVPTPSPAHWRGAREVRRLLAARCRACGFPNFPPSLRRLCVRCGGGEFEEMALARTGTVHTYTVNHYMPLPFQSPLPLVVADMDDGTRYVALGTEMRPEALSVGTAVELVLRRMTSERGVPVYAHKFRPLAL